MDPQAPDWISAVTRPLRDNPELELAARHELGEHAGRSDPGELATLAERFEAIDRTPAPRRRLLYWLPIALAFLAVLGAGLPFASHYRTWWGSLTPLAGGWSAPGGHSPTDMLKSQLTPDERMFVFGDTSQPSQELAARALWESQPENPLLFGGYIAHCDPLPADFLETARRIDPDNAWFLIVAAGELAENAVKKNRRPHNGPPDERPLVSDWEIIDEARFQEALALLGEASTKPRAEYYGARLLRQRLEILPAESDIRSRIARISFAATASSKDLFQVMRSSELLAAQADRLGQARDATGLRALIPEAEAFCELLPGQDGFLIQSLVTLTICTSTYAHLIEACERCDLTAEAARLRPKLAMLQTIK
mgnify:CR=1 FL=1